MNTDTGKSLASILTPRELEAALAIYDGLSNASGAKKLGIARPTFIVHLHTVFIKLNVASRSMVVRRVADWRAGSGKAGKQV